MILTVRCDPAFPAGTVSLPGGMAGGDRLRIRLGTTAVEASLLTQSPGDELLLAPDLWERLAIPYDGMRFRAATAEPCEIELGPCLGVLYQGEPYEEAEAARRAALFFGHLRGEPGLFAVGPDRGIDLTTGVMQGYLLDNRLAQTGRLVASAFPIPGVLRLAPGVQAPVRRELRRLTGNGVFNSFRSIGRWKYHTLLSQSRSVRCHLPETRRFDSAVDLAALLARYETVLVWIRGRRAIRLKRVQKGIRLTYQSEDQPVVVDCGDLAEAATLLRQRIGKGRAILEQGIDLTGSRGRALWVRSLTIQEGGGRWRLAFHAAYTADADLPGAPAVQLQGGTIAALADQCGLSRRQARRALRDLERLCIAASGVLGKAFHPLGVLGFDVALEPRSRRRWLLSVTASPRWPEPDQVRQRIARSQVQYGLSLTGFLHHTERLPD